MKRARFSEEQTNGVLKETEASAKTADLARRQGVSGATIYNWKAKYGGLEVFEAELAGQGEGVSQTTREPSCARVTRLRP